MRCLIAAVAFLVCAEFVVAAEANENPGRILTVEEAKSLCDDEVTWELADRGYDFMNFSDVKSINPDIARELAKSTYVGLILDGLTVLDKRTAKELAQHANHLTLNGLKELDEDVAAELAKCKGYLELRGLVRLSNEQIAKKIVELGLEQGGGLSLDNLEAITPDVASAFGAYQGDDLSLNGLKSIDDPDVAKGLAQSTVGRLHLGGLKTLNPKVAEQLGQSKARGLWLDGLTAIDGEAAKGLAIFGGELCLRGLKSLDKDAATALAEFKANDLVLSLITLDEDAVKALAKSELGELPLGGMKTISRETAAALAQFKGILDLSGLTSLDEPTAAELAKFQGKGLWLSGGNETVKEFFSITIPPRWNNQQMSDAVFGQFANFRGDELVLGLNTLSKGLAAQLANIPKHLCITGLKSMDDRVWDLLSGNESIEVNFSWFRTLNKSQAESHVRWAKRRQKEHEYWTPEHDQLSLEFLGDEAYAVLRKHDLIDLFSLNKLTPKQAADIVVEPDIVFDQLSLPLTSIDAPVARVLSKFPSGWLILEDLDSVTDDVVDILRANEGLELSLDFCQLKKLTLRQAKELVEIGPDEDKGSLPGLRFERLESVSKELAAILASYPGWLGLGDSNLEILSSITPEVCKELASHKGGLGLQVKTISAEAAEQLARHKGRLELYVFGELTAEAARELAKHRGEINLEINLDLDDESRKKIENYFYEERDKFLLTPR